MNTNGIYYSWAQRVQNLREIPEIRSYTKIARILGVNQVSVMRWAKGKHEPLWPFKVMIQELEKATNPNIKGGN